MSILIDKPKSFFTTHQDWTFPVPIAYGPGRLMEIGEKCSLLGIKNPLIVTDKGSADLPFIEKLETCLLYTSPSPRDKRQSRMPSSA